MVHSGFRIFVVSRRAFLKGAALAVAAPLIQRGRFCLFAQSEVAYSSPTLDLVQRSTVIDMLGLLTLDYRKLCSWETEPGCFAPRDFQKLKASGITIFHPAVGFTGGDPVCELRCATSPAGTFHLLPRRRILARRLRSRFRSGQGRRKDRHHDRPAKLPAFSHRGRCRQFLPSGPKGFAAHLYDNEIGGGSTDPRDPGLTEYGARIIARMNALGMAVDVSHCSDRTTLDALSVSRTPALVTHSNCRALVPGAPAARLMKPSACWPQKEA